MKRSSGSPLTEKEQEAIAAIRMYRQDLAAGLIPGPPETPSQLMHSLIEANHGHHGMHFRPIAHELGVTEKTLQRAFRRAYGVSMCRFQIQTRIEFVRLMLSQNPRPKLSVIARLLGYSDAHELTRMFREHTDTIPSKWPPEEDPDTNE